MRLSPEEALAWYSCHWQLPHSTDRDIRRMIRSLITDVPLMVTSRLADSNEYLEVLQGDAFDLMARPCQPTDANWVTRRAQQADKKRRASICRVKAHNGTSSEDTIRGQDEIRVGDMAEMATREQKQALS